MIKKMALSAGFLALGLILPFFTGQIPQIGSMLLPLHIPVFLCGLICGWKHGFVLGFILPLLRFVLFGMPPIYPTGIAMAFELATYGLVCGWIYHCKRKQDLKLLYISMIAAMVLGRIVWGIASLILLDLGQSGFTWSIFLSGALISAIPGILLQLIVIPCIMVALDKANLVPFSKESA